MAKFLIAKTLTINVENYSHGRPYIDLDLTLDYSLLDLIEIIKMYTGYANLYDWKFINPYEEDENLSFKNDGNKFDDIQFGKYRSVTPAIECFYGSVKMRLGVRGHRKYSKVYPTVIQAAGRFPTEEELVGNIGIADNDEKRSAEDLKAFEEKLKVYFKNKYKISDEIAEGSAFGQNKLVKK